MNERYVTGIAGFLFLNCCRFRSWSSTWYTDQTDRRQCEVYSPLDKHRICGVQQDNHPCVGGAKNNVTGVPVRLVQSC